MIPPLDPVVAQIIPLLPLRDPTTMTPQSARDALRALAASRAAVPPPPVMSAEDIKVKGAAGFLNARAYRNSSEKSPTVVFFHGGGWVAGDLDTHDRQARWLAIETGAVVVSVDYRRPPEVRFPGAFEDAFAATKDVIARIAEFGGDAARVGVAGDSAGGNLAATTAIACRDAGIKLAAQLLVYPVTDVAGNFADTKENARFPSRSENAEGYFLTRATMEWFCGHYLADSPTAPTGACRRCAPKTSQASRPRSSRPPGSIRSATRARPTPTRLTPPAFRPAITTASASSTAISASAKPPRPPGAKRNARGRISRRCWKRAFSERCAIRPNRPAAYAFSIVT